ncbi:unnamed protein product [Linum trigynum]|uniref:Uncharacterized protein n=1 Tax=Linum trigynum TaxID=586398 RepID=A0AAV2D1K7_9ROSI
MQYGGVQTTIVCHEGILQDEVEESMTPKQSLTSPSLPFLFYRISDNARINAKTTVILSSTILSSTIFLAGGRPPASIFRTHWS